MEDINETMTAYDDVSGEYLKPQEVLRARLKELQYIREKGVHKKISRQAAKKLGALSKWDKVAGHKQGR